ncbi:hypothetical protein DXG03_005914 [Asterophora parasitica]|uniref:Uncharacterized protein n=1 Tax=Asterophora parasitica TaxID=117018 RepID=A0A9P7G7W0_9AGAR|nr:hypothetical protein DXG03_005914 [Asterophora parasitica]
MWAILRILKTNKHLQRSRDPDVDIETFTALPRRPQHIHMTRTVASTPTPVSALHPPPCQRTSPAPSSATLATTKGYHVQPAALSLDALSSRPSSRASDDVESPVSSSFPRFENPPQAGTVTVDPDRITIESSSPPGEAWREILGASDSPDLDKRTSLKWNEDVDKSEFDYSGGKGNDGFVIEDSHSGRYAPQEPRSIGSTSAFILVCWF